MKKPATAIFLGLVLASALAISLAACGGSSSSTGTGTEEGGKPSGVVTIWDFEYESVPGYTKAVNLIDQKFEEKYPAVTIDRVAQPPENVNQVYQAAFVAHEGPDLMVMIPGAAGVLHFQQGLEPLNEYISSELESQLEHWELVTRGYKAKGEHLALPLGVEGNVFYYNKELFEKAGLPRDFEPKSWDDVLEAGKKLKAAGIQPWASGNKAGIENYAWVGAGFESLNSRQDAVELSEGQLPWTDPKVKQAFEPQFQIQEAGDFPAHRFGAEWAEGWAEFAEGKGAMTLGWWNQIGYWGEFNQPLGEKNVGIFFPPGPDSYVGMGALLALGMPQFAKNKDAAWAVLEFQVSKEGQEIMDRLGGAMPNRADVALPPGAPIQEQELAEAARGPNTGPQVAQMVPAPLLLGGALASETSEALQGRKSLDEALESIQEAAEATTSG